MGAIYALVALGLLQIFSAVRIVNFAQGQLVMLGAFIGITTVVQAKLPYPIAWMLTFAAMSVIGFVFMLIAYFPLRGRPYYLVILTTIALGIVIENLALIIWGPLPLGMPSPLSTEPLRFWGLSISRHVVLIFVVTAALLAAQHSFLTRTVFGRMMQATSQDMEAARLIGIRTNRTISAAFMMGAVFAAAAGILVAPIFLAEPAMGGPLMLKGFVVSVIGGFGSLPGAVIAGLLLGVIEAFAASYISSDFRDAYAFALMIAMLFARPQGIFGEKISERA